MQGVIYDITDRKLAETGSARPRRATGSLVEQLPLAIYIDALDEAGDVALQQPPERRDHRLLA